MNGNKIKLAIVGLGHVANFQLQALEYIDKFELVAICDTDKNKKNQVPDRIPFFTKYDDMIGTVNMDSVLISIPNKYHYEVAKNVLKSNKNLLLEKPATLNMKEIEELINIARTKGLTFVIAFHAAFAKDLLWFLENYETNLYKELGNITGFRCHFYDPYIINGVLLKHAEILDGSWIDSGINALSVIGKLVNNIEIEEAILTYVPQYNCSEIQGAVNFVFPINKFDKAGRGTIDTNWTLGINCKITRLYFANKKKEIVLHHSNQQVLLVYEDRKTKLLIDCSGDKPRLVNHYMGVFKDFYTCLMTGSDNLEYALHLHSLLLTPYKLKRGSLLCH